MAERVFDVEVEFYIPKGIDAGAYSSQLRKLFRYKFENAKTELKRIPGFWMSIRNRDYPGVVVVSYSVKIDSDMESVGKITYGELMENYPEFFPDGRECVGSVKVIDVMAYRSLDSD